MAPTLSDEAVFGFTMPGMGVLLSLGSGSLAERLTLRGDYTFEGGDLRLASGAVQVQLGQVLNLQSRLDGTSGLSLSGGGTLRLGNPANGFTGITTLANGILILSQPSQLGLSSSPVVITETNPSLGSTSTVGFGGGSLVLDGSGGGFTFSREIHLQGSGPAADRGGALVSHGDNVLGGDLRLAEGVSPRSSRILSAQGLLTLAGGVHVAGVAGTHVSSLGGVNSVGANADFRITGALTGTGTLNKQGAGMLVLTPSDTSGFSGRLRISGNAANGQSSVRVFSADVFGTANDANNAAPIDLNGGVLELHSNGGLAIDKNVYLRASSTLFVGPAIGGDGVNGTFAFGTLRSEANTTFTFNSRNGYGASFTVQSMQSSTNPSTFTNNMGGLLTFSGNFWNNNDASDRTLTISGSGNTRIDGSINTSGAGVKTLTKTNNGVLTLNGTATTLNGPVNVNGGAIAIRDFRALNNASTAIINLGTGTTAGALLIGTTEAATPEGLQTTRTLNLAGTTGTASIYANQAGPHPVILAGGITATGGTSANAKTLTLGGTSRADNLILGGIPNNAAGGSVALLKVGAGTWGLAGENTYSGTTTLANGTLKLLANAPASTVLPATASITFGANNGYAGATLDFVGRAGESSTQELNVLGYSAGSNTLRVTPGAGGSASLLFARINTTGAATLNIVGADFLHNRVTLTRINDTIGGDGIITRSVFWNGADYAYREGGVLRAPVYGSDVGTAVANASLVASTNNLLTTSVQQGSVSVLTLKIAGSQTLNLNTGATLTLSSGGLLVDGGTATIAGGTVALGSQAFVVRVNQPGDSLTLASVNTGSGGLTKSGAGTLVLAGPSSRTGTVSVDEGTLRLADGGVLSGANTTLNIRQNAVFDLNGVSTGTAIGQFNNNGVVLNSASQAAELTLGNNNGTGTSFGSIRDGAGLIHVTKVGSGNQVWQGLSTYTGITTLGGSGLVTVDVLANGGQASGIGASGSDAANLVFAGGGLSYRGNLYEGILNLGSTSASTDRLFTVTGAAVTLGSSPTTNLNNAIVWSNPGAIVHGTPADRTFTFNGTSQGFNTFNPQLTDSPGFATSVVKSGTGIWRLGSTGNTYSGSTTITQGILMATDGQGLSPNSNLVFDGGTLYSQGTLQRNIGTGPGEMRFASPAANTAQFAGGFLGGDSRLTVSWSGVPVWGATAGFLDDRDGLLLNGSQARGQGATGSIALSEVDIAGDFSLGTVAGAALGPNLSYTVAQNSATVTVASTAGLRVGQSVTGSRIPSGAYIVSILSATQFQMSANTANVGGTAGTYTDGAVLADALRAIRVDDNGNTGGDFATLSGAISGAAGLRKTGGGLLRLTGANTYGGETNVNQGTLAVRSLGHSSDAVGMATSVGLSGVPMNDDNAVTLGNGGTGAGILQYIGPGETSDRKIRLNTTTGSTQIFADGTGPLILSHVANDVITATGNKTLFLRGSHSGPNQITSRLSDNGGALAVTVDGGAMWILTNPLNDYTGLTTAGGGALGIGSAGALGGSTLRLSNGSVFAYGGDLTLANPVDQANNTTGAFIGDHSLTFTSAYALLATTSNPSVTTNNLAAGKTLTFGGVTANSITANRTWTIEGGGTTVIDGDISTTTAFGLPIVKTGNGVLQLNGTGSNFNQNNANLDIDRGTIRLGNSEVIPHGAGYGNLLISPELANEDVAILDLNGRTETINGLTATTDGTAVIDNTAAGAAVLTFGANDAAVNFGTGAGTYAITDSGLGRLSLVKTGAGTAVIGGGSGTTTLDYRGTTTVEAGVLQIGSALTGTTGIRVDGGAALNLFNGAADGLAALDLLSLGAGTGTTVLGLELGSGTLTSDRLVAAGGATTANTIQFDLLGLTGFGGATRYDLIAAASGLATGSYQLNRAPGGYSYSLSVSDSLVSLHLTALAAGDLYWRGDLSSSWSQLSGGNSNFSTDLAGTLDPGGSPGAANTVLFATAAGSGTTIVTTLDNAYAVNALKFAAQPAGFTSVSIAPGASPSFALTIAPSVAADGIDVADSAGAVTVSAPVVLGADQTWTVAGTGVNGSSLTVSGPLSGAASLVKAGAGTLVLSGDNSQHLGTMTVDAGTLQIGAGGGTGTLGAGELLNNGTLFFNRTGTFTVANRISGTGSLTKGASGVLLLTHDGSSFEGDVTVSAGTLGYTTVSDIGGPASSLGRGGAITLTGGTLRFDGPASQSTNRPITTTGAATLSANGVLELNTITYAGAITVGPTADGSQLTLTGTAGRQGFITGGITQTGTTADLSVSGGIWSFSGTQSSVADDLVVTGVGTVLNLDSTGIVRLLSGGGGADLTIRNGSVVNINATDAVQYTGSNYRLFVGQGADGADAFLQLNADLVSGRFILGERGATRVGIVNGTGTLTVSDAAANGIELYRGEFNANLANTANTTNLNKLGAGTVILRGNNSGLVHTASSIITDGTLVLDFTLNNDRKLSALAPLDMRGSRLEIIGSSAADTLQTVASFTLATGSGNSFIDITAGAGRTATLALGALTRGASAGTLRLVYQDDRSWVTTTTANTNGVVGSAAHTTVRDTTGTWFGTNEGGRIVPLASTLENHPSAWANAAHVSDAGSGFTGTVGYQHLGSLRFDAAGGSVVNLAAPGVLTVASGGLLITDQVTSGSPGLLGGTLGSGVTELIVTQDSLQPFQISARLGVNNALTKTGPGTLLLNGKQGYTGSTSVQNGILQISGGNALSDSGIVTLASNRNSILQLFSSETIGRLQGGQRNTNSEYGQVILGPHTLSLNQSGGNTTYAGKFFGTGSLVLNAGSVSNLNLSGVSTGFTGSVFIHGGLLQLSGLGRLDASSVTVTLGAMLLDNNSTTTTSARLLDTTPILLHSAMGAWGGETRPSGLSLRRDQNSALIETVGVLTLGSGANYSRFDTTGGTNAQTILQVSDLVREQGATLAIRGVGLGLTSGARSQLRILDAANQDNFLATLVGAGGAAGTPTLRIVPWAFGENTSAALADTNMGNTLVTYVSGAGFRPLDLGTEYATFATAGAANNTRDSLTADLTGLAGRTLNAWVIHNNSAAASALNVSGAGAGAELVNTSGTFLFTLNPAAEASSVHSVTLDGFEGGIRTTGGEYVFFVQNPVSTAASPTLTARIGSALSTPADIVKAGRGTLVLTSANTAGGNLRATYLNEGILEIAGLANIGGPTGGLYFAGGTLRLGAGFTDDLSTRLMVFLPGGGSIDTQGQDLSLAGPLGSGVGGFTKTGEGNLSLFATATYTGNSVLALGSVTAAADNALGSGGNLTLLAGTTLALGGSSLSHAVVTTAGASPLITGTGTLNATGGFNFNHTGDTQIDARLGGAGGLFKTQANLLTLTGLNTYTGSTEVRAGGLVFNSIGNVGSGPSALGNPGSLEDGILRMGLTTAATSLTYTGGGHSTDRLIGMQGTTGSLTLIADGSGAIAFTSGARFETPGNKTLFLRGSSDPFLVNEIGALTQIGGVLTLNKSDANTWMLGGASAYTGATQIDNGTLMIGTDQALPATTSVRLGTGTTAAVLDLNAYDQAIAALEVRTNSAALTSQLRVPAGKALTVGGNITIGANAAGATTLFSAIGGGSFVQNAPGGVFQVGGATGNTNTSTTVADFSGLAHFSVNLGANGTFRVGDANSNSSGNPVGNSNLILASTSASITAGSLNLGQGTGQGASVQTLSLGAGLNTLNVDILNIGGNTSRSGGALLFAGTTGSLVLRGADGASPATVNMMNGAINTAISSTASLELAGHEADLRISTLTMAAKSSNAGIATAGFTFDQGTLDIDGLIMTSNTGAYAGIATSNVLLGGGGVNIGLLTLATNTSTGTSTAVANFRVTGGTVTLGSGSGTAIQMANAAAGRIATSEILLSGGSVSLAGDVIRQGGAGTENATFILDGAALDMGGFSIGTAATPILFEARSGSLKNLAEFNGGESLIKSSTGILRLLDGNAYSGETFVTAGTLLAANTTGSATGSGPVFVEAGATLGGNGRIAPALDSGITVLGRLQVGEAGDTSAQKLTLSTTGEGLTTVNGVVAFDLFGGQGSGTLNAQVGNNDQLVVNGTSGFSIGASSTLQVSTSLPIDASWVVGTQWRLFDWSGLSGDISGGFANVNMASPFNDIHLPDLSTIGLAWDVSNLYTAGTIMVVVPEPGRLLLVFFGLLGLFFRRRR